MTRSPESPREAIQAFLSEGRRQSGVVRPGEAVGRQAAAQSAGGLLC